MRETGLFLRRAYRGRADLSGYKLNYLALLTSCSERVLRRRYADAGQRSTHPTSEYRFYRGVTRGKRWTGSTRERDIVALRKRQRGGEEEERERYVSEFAHLCTPRVSIALHLARRLELCARLGEASLRGIYKPANVYSRLSH